MMCNGHTYALHRLLIEQGKDNSVEFIYYIMAGAAVGFAVGLTGVGGGSLMTPLLLLFGFPPHIAVGTDLLYAALTKASGVVAHHRMRTIEWRTVGILALGSLPASLVTIWVLGKFFDGAKGYQSLITTSLGAMLILTSIVLIFKGQIVAWVNRKQSSQTLTTKRTHNVAVTTCVMGLIMGVLVTLSSVGAGAFCTAVLLVLYPKLSAVRVVGTDLAHAVPLTLIGGIGHMFLGNVDYALLGALLVGSLPAIHIGTRFAKKMPEQWLRPVLASALLGLGIKYAVF